MIPARPLGEIAVDARAKSVTLSNSSWARLGEIRPSGVQESASLVRSGTKTHQWQLPSCPHVSIYHTVDLGLIALKLGRCLAVVAELQARFPKSSVATIFTYAGVNGRELWVHNQRLYRLPKRDALLFIGSMVI